MKPSNAALSALWMILLGPERAQFTRATILRGALHEINLDDDPNNRHSGAAKGDGMIDSVKPIENQMSVHIKEANLRHSFVNAAEIPRSLQSSDACSGNFCHKNAFCTPDRSASRGYNCQCDPGYEGDGIWVCRNHDECLGGPSTWPCPQIGAVCVDHDPTDTVFPMYECRCAKGFVETASDIHGATVCEETPCFRCSPDATCIIVDSDYNCKCNAGFTGDGYNCALDPRGQEDTPSPTDPCDSCDPITQVCNTYSTGCTCAPGYFSPSGVGGSCRPVQPDDCANEGVCDKNAKCVDIPGPLNISFFCVCNHGFVGSGRPGMCDVDCRSSSFETTMILDFLGDGSLPSDEELAVLARAFRNTYNALNINPNTCDALFREVLDVIYLAGPGPEARAERRDLQRGGVLGTSIPGFHFNATVSRFLSYFVRVPGKCRGCPRNSLLFDEAARRQLAVSTDKEGYRNLIDTEEPCFCPTGVEAGRAPSRQEFQSAYQKTVQSLRQSEQIATVESLREVIELEEVLCDSDISTRSTDVSLTVTVKSLNLTSQEIDALQTAFVESYNNLADNSCDPKFRTILSATLVETTELSSSSRRRLMNQQFLSAKFKYQAVFSCRGCQRGTSIFRDDASRFLDVPGEKSKLPHRRLQQGDTCFCDTNFVTTEPPSKTEFALEFKKTVDVLGVSAVVSVDEVSELSFLSTAPSDSPAPTPSPSEPAPFIFLTNSPAPSPSPSAVPSLSPSAVPSETPVPTPSPSF